MGSNVEIPIWFSSTSNIDFKDTLIEFSFSATTFLEPDPNAVRFFGGTGFNGYQFIDINYNISPFKSVRIDSSLSNLPFEFSSSRLSYDDNNVWIDFQGLTFNDDSKLVLSINTPLSAPVPEPETGAMLILGLGLLSLATKRKGY